MVDKYLILIRMSKNGENKHRKVSKTGSWSEVKSEITKKSEAKCKDLSWFSSVRVLI